MASVVNAMRCNSAIVRILVLIVPLVLGGCLSATLAPTAQQLSGVRTLIVIPVEPPPLLGPPYVVESTGAQVVRGALPLTTVPIQGFPVVGNVLVAGGGLVMLLEAAAAGKPTGESDKLVDLDEMTEGWTTVMLRDEVATQLRLGGVVSSVAPARQYRRLDVGDRRYTWHMENWYKPLRAWYNAETAGLQYAGVPADTDTVLEVGLLNFEVAGPRIIVRVMMRLLDPHIGRLIGRTQKASITKLADIKAVVTQAGLFRETFASIARPLITACLRDLRLLPSEEGAAVRATGGSQAHGETESP